MSRLESSVALKAGCYHTHIQPARALIPRRRPDVQFDVQGATSGVESGTANDFTKASFGTPKASLATMFETNTLGTLQNNGAGLPRGV